MFILQHFMLMCLVFTYVCFLPTSGLGLSVIGAVYLALTVPYVVSSIVVGKLTDKLVRYTLV